MNISPRAWRFLLLWMGFCLADFSVVAQNQLEDKAYTDSLMTLVKATSQDTIKVDLLNQLSDYWSVQDSGKAAHYARMALQYSEGHPFQKAQSYFTLAGGYFYFDADKSRLYYKKTIQLLAGDTSTKARVLKSRSWYNYGALIQRTNGDTAFLKILFKHVIPLAKKAKDTGRLALGKASIGMSFYNLYEYQKAIPYFKAAIKLAESRTPPPSQLTSYYYKLAKNYLFNEQIDSAKNYLDKCKVLLSGQSDQIDWAMYYKVLGRYYSENNQFEAANRAFDSALSILNTMHWPYLKAGVLFQKYFALKHAQHYNQAYKLLFQLYQDSVMMSKSGNKLTVLYNLAELDAQLGNTKQAYKWMLQYASFRDSVRREDARSKISALEIKYQSEKKQSKILALQNKTQSQEISLQKKRIQNSFLVGGIIVLLLVCAIVFILYRNKKQSAQQESKIHEQKLDKIRQENQLKVYNAMIEGQEQERRRMARDLHDGLGGMLSGVKLKLSDIIGKKQDKNDMELYNVINQLDGSVQELRRIAKNMMPETLLRFGVETALNDLCNSLQTKQVKVDFQAYQIEKDLPQHVQVSIYRIIQELLANAIRHGRCSNILVQISQNEDRLFITVEDDGEGFDVNLLTDKKGIGLSNIKNRINFLGGKLDIDSTPKEGTTVNVEVNTHE